MKTTLIWRGISISLIAYTMKCRSTLGNKSSIGTSASSYCRLPANICDPKCENVYFPTNSKSPDTSMTFLLKLDEFRSSIQLFQIWKHSHKSETRPFGKMEARRNFAENEIGMVSGKIASIGPLIESSCGGKTRFSRLGINTS